MAGEDARSKAGFETGFATGLSRARRMEVIPAGPVRREWSADAKARIIEESFAPGANIAAVARAHDIIPQQLYRWRHRSRKVDGMDFVPVVVDRADDLAPVGSASEIVIRAGGLTIHVPAGVTSGHIERVMLAARHLV